MLLRFEFKAHRGLKRASKLMISALIQHRFLYTVLSTLSPKISIKERLISTDTLVFRSQDCFEAKIRILHQLQVIIEKWKCLTPKL